MYWKSINRLLLLSALLAGGAAPSDRHETVVFGTRVAITFPDDSGQERAQQAAVEEIFALFGDMHRRFHPWRDGELRQVNAHIAAGRLPLTVSAPMAEMIARAKEYSALSGGLFDPGIGALVRLWGFHADTLPQAPPPPAAVAMLLESRAGMGKIAISGRRLLAAPAAVQLDFSALAKGVALDEARAVLRRHGIANALIDIGGNIMALGKNSSRPWRVAIAPDRSQAPALQVLLHDGEAVATSGGSERHFIHEGRRYHHIIDPRSGYPAAETAAAAVIASGRQAGAVSDALATALVIADADEMQRMLPRFGVALAWRTDGAATPAMRQRMDAGSSGFGFFR